MSDFPQPQTIPAPAPASSTTPRRSSSDSFASESDGPRSPTDAFDSSAALILVTDADEHETETFDFSSDDDDQGDEGLHQLQRLRSSSIPPLSPIAVFLYLLTPLLKLGALLSANPHSGSGQLPLKIALPMLFFFASLCAFTRQIWYMLARYVRRADIEEVLLETFARGRGREERRRAIRLVARFLTGSVRVLGVAVYMRASADFILPLLPERWLIPTRIPLTILLALFVSPLCFAPSLGVSSVQYATWSTVVTYVAWVACTAYAHAKGTLASAPQAEGSLGSLWQGISIIAFTFATTTTLPLYAALRGAYQPGAPKPKRSQSFKTLSALSVGLAAVLILPPTIFRERAASPFFAQIHDGEGNNEASSGFKVIMALAGALTLLLSIPSIIISTPPLPIPVVILRRTNFPVSKTCLYILMLIISLLPTSLFRVASDVLLVLTLTSTYFVPAFIHIVIHNFRRPLSIIIPPNAPITPNPATAHVSAETLNDELLQRKERALQRRRLLRRIVWDVGVWVLLLPVSGGGFVWAGGRIAGRW